MLVYNETSVGGGRPIKYDQINATKGWLTHYGNYRYLFFVSNNELATAQERAQARKEILIAERKMAYHARHPNFNQSDMLVGRKQIDTIWGIKHETA